MKFQGWAGFELNNVEVEPGVYESQIVRKKIRGDVVSSVYRQVQNGSNSTIDNIRQTNQLSILANQFFMTHINTLKYVEYQGIKWKVETFTIKSPRVNLTLGGPYNEQ